LGARGGVDHAEDASVMHHTAEGNDGHASFLLGCACVMHHTAEGKMAMQVFFQPVQRTHQSCAIVFQNAKCAMQIFSNSGSHCEADR